MTFFKAVSKLSKRKKRNGYYEASEILTVEEKNSILLVSICLITPLIVSSLLLLVN